MIMGLYHSFYKIREKNLKFTWNVPNPFYTTDLLLY